MRCQRGKADYTKPHCGYCTKLVALEKLEAKDKTKLINKIYSAQKASSKKRGHEPPSYTKEWLRQWLLNQHLFHELYKTWSTPIDREKDNIPSVDRIKNGVGYTKDNIQLMTWRENNTKN